MIEIARFQTTNSQRNCYIFTQTKIAASKIVNKAGFQKKHNPKQNAKPKKMKLIVNSLRLLHETFLYFEIGSNQVANNDNNFCNKIKHETNPHEFNNFATQELFFSYNFFFYFLNLLRTHIPMYNTTNRFSTK